jgi:hypothetical protein
LPVSGGDGTTGDATGTTGQSFTITTPISLTVGHSQIGTVFTVEVSTMKDSTVEGPVLRFIRPERRTPSLGCIPVRLAELITEASCTATPRGADRALVEVSRVEVCTAEADAADSRFVPQFKKKDGGSYAKENQIR